MRIEMKPLDTITPYDANPRRNEAAVGAVAESIKRFGFRQPIVVDAEGVIVCGHTRWKAARSLGLDKAPVHVAADLTPEQARAYRVADNRTAELSEWDEVLLPGELAALPEMDWTALGFDDRELQRLLDPLASQGLSDPDAVPEPPSEPRTKRGDLWLLGEHRLMCGDSALPDDVDRLTDGEPVQLVNTDPPYNVAVQPRSNNAFVTGQTNFAPKKQHASRRVRGVDSERKGGPKTGTTVRLRAKHRPLEIEFVSDVAVAWLL